MKLIIVNNTKCESLCPFSKQGIYTLIEQGVHDQSFKDFVNDRIHIHTIDDICVQGDMILVKNMTLAMKQKNPWNICKLESLCKFKIDEL